VQHQGHTTVGLLGMQWLMEVLTDTGHADVALTIATRTDRPSWGYMIGKGATTIWERYLFTSLKAAQIQHLEDFAGHMLPLGLS